MIFVYEGACCLLWLGHWNRKIQQQNECECSINWPYVCFIGLDTYWQARGGKTSQPLRTCGRIYNREHLTFVRSRTVSGSRWDRFRTTVHANTFLDWSHGRQNATFLIHTMLWNSCFQTRMAFTFQIQWLLNVSIWCQKHRPRPRCRPWGAQAL